MTFWNWSKNILKHIIFSLFSLFSIQVILQWLSVWAIKLTSCRDIMLAFNMHFKVGFNLWAVSTFIRLFDGHGINQRINLKQFSFHVFYLCDSAKTFCLGNKTDIFESKDCRTYMLVFDMHSNVGCELFPHSVQHQELSGCLQIIKSIWESKSTSVSHYISQKIFLSVNVYFCFQCDSCLGNISDISDNYILQTQCACSQHAF